MDSNISFRISPYRRLAVEIFYPLKLGAGPEVVLEILDTTLHPFLGL